MQTKITKSIEQAIHCLNQNDVLAIPTETVYGLAGKAYSTEAVIKIFEAKERPIFNPLIVHTSSIEKSRDFVKEWPEPLYRLAEVFCPGPITFLLPRKDIVPDLVTAGSHWVGVRIPQHPVTLELLRNLEFPLAAPSANPFGYVSPTTAEHVYQNLKGKIPLILDGGPCKVGLESTIVGIENNELVVYRLGGVTLEEIEKVVGKIRNIKTSSSKPQAPGMLIQHYAPKKKFVLTNDLEKFINLHKSDKFGIIFWGEELVDIPVKTNLSEEKSLQEASQNLFQALRAIESWQVDYVVMEWLPEVGLGRAINDRIKRAATEIIDY